jgi:hypothetical protein
MLAVLVVGVVVAGFGSIASAAYRDVVTTDNPVGYWRVNETSGTVAADQTANAISGSYLGGVTLGVTGALSGDSDRAVRLDGVDDRISMGDPASGLFDFAGDFSVEAWIKTTVNAERCVISKVTSAGRGWQITVTDDPGTVGFIRARVSDGSTTRYSYGPAVRVDDGNWHHVVVTVARASGTTVYVDKRAQFTAGTSTFDVTNTAALLVGSASGYPFFVGDTDEVALYGTALSQARVSAHFDAATALDTTPPAPTLTAPPDGGGTSSSTPTFSGRAGTAAGDSSTVTVKVYSGSSATGTPLETLSATRALDGSYTAPSTLVLADGTYTARTEQLDASGNLGFSSANTFQVDHTVPVVTLTSPVAGSTLGTRTPTFAGTGGTAAGDATSVTVKLYSGASATGTPIQTFTAPRQADGSYVSAPASSLADGTYTARAEQADSAGNVGLSSAVTFGIDGTTPIVTLTSPGDGSATNDTTPAFNGVAGTAAGDAASVTVRVYAGTSASGTPVQSLSASRQADASYGVSAFPALPEGTYTARAEQSDTAGNTGLSAPTTFRIDTATPAVTLTVPADGSATNVTAPTIRGTAGAALGDSATVTVRVYSGGSASGTPVRVLTATRQADNSYAVTTNPALAEGTYTAQAEQADTAGNTGASAPSTFRIDTTAPTVTLTNPSDGSSTSNHQPSFRGSAGTAENDSTLITVRVYAGTTATGTPEQVLTTTRQADGSYAVSASPALAEGTYTAQAEQGDVVGNSGFSNPVTFRIDPAASTVALTSPANGSVTNDATPAFAGTAGTGAGDSGLVTVKLYAGTTPTGTPVEILTATRQGDGSFTVDASSPLTEGTYTAQAEQTSNGNLSVSSPATFRVDITSPTVSLTEPAAGSVTDHAAPTFRGTGGTAAGDAATVVVSVYAGATATGTPIQTLHATRQADGSYAVAAGSPLAEATYTAQAEQLDSAGNRGTSAAVTFRVDTTAPSVSLTSPAPGSATSDTTPTFAGLAGTAADDSATVTVRLYAGGSATGTPLETLIAGVQAGGSFSVDPAGPLAEGTYTVQATQSDVAGNNGASAAVTFDVDTTPPAVTLTAPVDGSATSDTTPTFRGTAGATPGDSATITVKVYSGPSVAGTPVEVLSASRQADASFAVAAFPALTQGLYTVQAHQSDSAGNAASSTPVTFRIDTAIPTVTLTSPAAGAATNDTTPTFAGTAGTDAGDSATVTVRVYSGASAGGTPVQTVTATRQPGGSFAVDASPALAEGRYTAQASQTNDVGNTGLSEPVTFRVDTTAPVLQLTTPVDGAALNETTPPIRGVADSAVGDSPTITIKLYAGSAVSGTPLQTLTATRQTGSFFGVAPFPALAEGTYTAQAQQSDNAGNTGSSAPTTFRIDTTAPTVTLTSPANGSALSDGAPTFGGQAGTAVGDLATVTVKVYGGTTAAGPPVQTLPATRQPSGAYSVPAATSLVPGTYTAQAEQQDSAGNRRVSSATTFSITTYRQEVLADTPVAYWRLGEATGTVATDQAGTNAGQYRGGFTLGQPGALVGDADTATRIDGTSGYISVANSASFSLGDVLSLEAWVKRSTLGTDQRIFHKGSGWALLRFTTTNRVLFAKSSGGDITTSTVAITDTTRWHHIVATKNGTTVRLYVDGVDATGPVANQTVVNTTSSLNIGRDTGGSQYFNGLIDDAAIYRQALSPTRVRAHYNKGVPPSVDTTPPTVQLTLPANGGSVADATPTFSGSSANDLLDSFGVSVKVYSGTSATGTPVATATATRDANGSWAVDVSTRLAPGTYTARAYQSDAAGNTGASSPATFALTTPPSQPPTDPVLLAAGDIADCFSEGDEATADILDDYPSALVTTLGDNAYENGTPEEFANCFEPTWGRAKSRIRPTVGDHEYHTPSAAGYFAYFNTQLAPFGSTATTKGYYSYNVGSWHVVVLNSNCAEVGGCGPGSPQEQWLRADLAANPTTCTLGTVAGPRFSSGGRHGNEDSMQPFWQALYDHGADLVLSGDDHDFERFSPQTPSGLLDLAGGITGFVVGTGGQSHYLFSGGTLKANSEVRNDDSFGVLKLTLHASSYEWEFLPEAGKTFTDVGSRLCHGDTVPASVTLTQPANGATVTTSTPTFSGTAGSAAGDSTTITVKVYAGSTTSGAPVQTLTATRQADNSYSVTGNPPLAIGTYTAQAEQADAAGNLGKSSANTFTIPDVTPPAVTLTQPANGAALTTFTPVFSGTAGNAPGDSATVKVKVYTGTSPTGTPVRTLTTTRQADNSYSVTSAVLVDGTYTAQAEQSDGTNVGKSSANTFTVDTPSSPNPIIAENQQTGTDTWQLWRTGFDTATDTQKQIKGYASATSVNKGGSISFHVTVNPAQTFTMDIYRMGWYAGKGGRLMQHVGPLSGVRQPACPPNATTGRIECHWPAAHTLTVPTTWTTGVYLVLLTNAQNFQNYITFVVRDDGRIGDILYQQSITTDQAYNGYPNDGQTGKSLYDSGSHGANTVAGTPRAVEVSFDRPYQDEGDGDFLQWEVWMVQWLERSGYDVNYSTDVDTDANPARLMSYKAFLSVGHDEYWSKPMYDGAEAARDAGVNLGFFGANEVYWQIRMAPSSTGVPGRTIVCYKDQLIDPVQGPTTTVRWRDPFLNRPEQKLVGVQYKTYFDPVQGNTNYPHVVTNSSHWIYNGTGLADGNSIPQVVGYEVDQYMSDFPLPTSVAGTYALLSHSPIVDIDGVSDYSNSSIYQAPSGARVFGAGSIVWSYGLAKPGVADTRFQRMTANVVNNFIGG